MRERDRQRKKDNNKSQENCDWFQLNIVEHCGTLWNNKWLNGQLNGQLNYL